MQAMSEYYTMCFSVKGFFRDNLKCLLEGSKIAKRIKRGRFWINNYRDRLNEEDIERFNVAVGEVVEVNNIFEVDVALEYLEEKFNRCEIAELRKDEINYTETAVNAKLTSALNNDGVVYDIMLKVYLPIIINIISNNPEFKQHIIDGDIVHCLKGGMAARLYLVNEGFDEKIVDELFGYGDFDCGFIVNPALPNYTQICKSLCGAVYGVLRCLTMLMNSNDSLINKIYSVDKVDIGDKSVSIKPTLSRSFYKLYAIKEMIKYEDDMNLFRVSANHIVSDEGEFWLSRVKVAYGGGKAEVIDVSICYKWDCVEDMIGIAVKM